MRRCGLPAIKKVFLGPAQSGLNLRKHFEKLMDIAQFAPETVILEDEASFYPTTTPPAKHQRCVLTSWS